MNRIYSIGILLLAIVISGCSQETKVLDELKGQIVPENYTVSEENGALLAEVRVSMPDYSQIMMECIQEAEENSEDEKDFQDQLYRLTKQRCAQDGSQIRRSITINLSELDENREMEDWTEKDIFLSAREAAFEMEEEELCLEMIASDYQGNMEGREEEGQ